MTRSRFATVLLALGIATAVGCSRAIVPVNDPAARPCDKTVDNCPGTTTVTGQPAPGTPQTTPPSRPPTSR